MNTSRLAEELGRPFVGIVKSIDKDRGYGFIMIEYQKDIYFKLKECHIDNITPLTYVAFRKRISQRTNKIEAFDINHISDYKDDLLRIKEKLLVSEKDLIFYCNKDLYEKTLEDKIKYESEALKDINRYVDNLNISAIIESYSVKVEEGHIYKPGDDDSAMVDYVGSRTEGEYLFRYSSGFTSCWQRDEFLDKLLPNFRKKIFYERAFCPWEDILAGFGDLSEYHKKAKDMTKSARRMATVSYNRDKHKEYLMNMLNRKICQKKDDYKKSIIESLEGSLKYSFNLDVSLKEMKF